RRQDGGPPRGAALPLGPGDRDAALYGLRPGTRDAHHPEGDPAEQPYLALLPAADRGAGLRDGRARRQARAGDLAVSFRQPCSAAPRMPLGMKIMNSTSITP